MKRTPLFDLHVDAGAKIGEYAGWEMPLFYPLGVKAEHLHTRQSAGLFDISHMLHVDVRGSGAEAYIARLCPYDVRSQSIGECRYTFFLNEQACIIDDLIVTRLEDERFRVVANAGCADKDFAHMQSHLPADDVTIAEVECGFLALQGPKAEAILDGFGLPVSSMTFMTGCLTPDNWFLSRTGYTGEDGFEIALPLVELQTFAKTLAEDDRVEWIGLAARDSLRLEAGLSLYGQDLDDTITPHEAGLIWAIPNDIRKDGVFVGASALAEKIAAGRTRMRVGLLPQGRPIRADTPLINERDEEIGAVTSGGFGPSINAPVALGLIQTQSANEPIFANMRGKAVPMTRSQLPFTPHRYKR